MWVLPFLAIFLAYLQYSVVPPYGQEEIEEIQSIFEVPTIRDTAIFLDTQCEYAVIGIYHANNALDRMPIQLGEFISEQIYNGQLRSFHKIKDEACFFVDVAEGREKRNDKSWEAFYMIMRWTTFLTQRQFTKSHSHHVSSE